MIQTLKELIMVQQQTQDLSIWPLIAASILVAAAVMRRRQTP